MNEQLPSDEFRLVEAHVEGCLYCQAVLRWLLTRARQSQPRLCAIQARVGAPAAVAESTPGAGDTAPMPPGADLPQIPGYDVQAVLGRGGMGVVYKAWHLRLGRPVALKMILAGGHAGPEERERFLREARAVAGLRHPNIVHLYDVADHEGRPYFTMELVEGGSLAQRLSVTPQPAREAAALLATLAEAVQVAHDGGIVHRDLKPANILLAADGAPKIADFGLARHLEGGAGVTQSGAAVGTPSYMAPEQAQGKARTLQPAVDVYSLGAILYEALTGRPPFRAGTAAETVLQAIHQEPVAPSRLVAKVPRDLETICLKCLHKQPTQRYASSADLADDLRRFLRGDAIEARPEGRLRRAIRRARRRPTQVVSLTAGLAFTAALAGGGLWVRAERGAAERSQTQLDRLDRVRRNEEFVARLDMIRSNRAVFSGGYLSVSVTKTQADAEYETAYREAGFGKVHDDPDAAAARVAASDFSRELVAALDDWAVCATNSADPLRQGWILGVARRADPDPTGARDRLRDPAAWKDTASLGRLAPTALAAKASVQLLVALGERLHDAGADAVPFLVRVQREHPGDFWANLTLGEVLATKRPAEAVRYYQAALAVRPGVAGAHFKLGYALALSQRADEAIHCYRRATTLDPKVASSAGVHDCLAAALYTNDQRDEAVAHYLLAAKLDPTLASPHRTLGDVFRWNGLLDEAVGHHHLATKLDPKFKIDPEIPRSLRVSQGRAEEVRVAWRKALEADPPAHDAWHGYAELCLFGGHDDEYRRVRRALLSRFGTSADPMVAERTGRACLLLPATDDELHQAAALLDRAVSAKESAPAWARPFLMFAGGLAEYRRGRLEGAIAVMTGDASRVLGPAPGLVLAMAQYRQGRKELAQKTLAAATVAFDWGPGRAWHREAWTYHVLRREAESLILADLPAFLEGKRQPQDHDERLVLLGVCESKALGLAAARLYADAFAADPRLAEDSKTKSRYRAARSAALAGCGRGGDAAKLTDTERARWRKQAREWLRADLAAPAGKPGVGTAAGLHLSLWQIDPDLAGLREPGAIGQLPADERADCLALWSEVGTAIERARQAK